jgi:hypothetical protein
MKEGQTMKGKPTAPIRSAALVVAASLCLAASASPARAGTYMVAQCSPGTYSGAPDASFGATTTHYVSHVECASGKPGLEITHHLKSGETGTVKGANGSWWWTAPPGTYISGGTTYSRLAAEDGQHGYLAVSPETGPGLAFAAVDDNHLHESGIPAGYWHYLVARLECMFPNQGNRCVGAATGAHTFVKQVRIELTDDVAPTLSLGGSALSGAELRGPQGLAVSAADVGAGLASVQVSVNGRPAGGESLAASCNPLPGGLTSRMEPCPLSYSKTFTLRTEAPPFVNGTDIVSACVYDYSQSGPANSACQSREVFVEDLCPGSPIGGGQTIRAGFPGTGTDVRTLRFGRRALVRGRLRDGSGNAVSGAAVCLEAHTELPGRPYELVGTTTTNQNGGFAFELPRGPSRAIRIAYRFGSFQTEADLSLRVRAHSTLQISRRRIRPRRRVYFSGQIPGPENAGRVVIVSGSVPGARQRYMIRRARTNALGRFRVGYAFSPLRRPTRFVFWTEVPEQSGYPYADGRSPRHYIHVRP